MHVQRDHLKANRATTARDRSGYSQPPAASHESRFILGVRVDATSYAAAASQITRWAANHESRYVCVSTVHMVMEGHDNPDFQRIVNQSDLVTSDGMPLVWGLRMLGVPSASRVYGPDLTPIVCQRAADEGIPVGFYGGTPRSWPA